MVFTCTAFDSLCRVPKCLFRKTPCVCSAWPGESISIRHIACGCEDVSELGRSVKKAGWRHLTPHVRWASRRTVGSWSQDVLREGACVPGGPADRGSQNEFTKSVAISLRMWFQELVRKNTRLPVIMSSLATLPETGLKQEHTCDCIPFSLIGVAHSCGCMGKALAVSCEIVVLC